MVKLTAAIEKTPAMTTVADVLKEEVGRSIGMVSDLICLGNFFGVMVRWFLSTKKRNIEVCVYILRKLVKLNFKMWSLLCGLFTESQVGPLHKVR